MVAGRNFGCGSSREHSPVALKAAGVGAVVAKSFARIFFRNSINIGLPILICADTDMIDDGDELELDVRTGLIRDVTKGKEIQAEPLPDFVMKIVLQGGLVPFLRDEGYV